MVSLTLLGCRTMSMPANILIVEDEVDLAELISHNLVQEGYACRICHDGRQAMEELSSRPPDAIILDRMLPGLSGDEIVARIKRDARLAVVPVLMLTAKAHESDELVGLALGADDYITKPFSVKLLLARLAAALRRTEALRTPPEPTTLAAGPIRLNARRFEVMVEQEQVILTATEFRLLRALMNSEGDVLTRDQLIDIALGRNAVVTPRAIDVHLTALRKKLGPGAGWIQTIRGVGYSCRRPE